MKKLIYILMFFVSMYPLAQEYPLNTSAYEVPAGSYMKDTNNEYNKYVGLWKGDWNGKTVYLELKKIKQFYSGTPAHYRDEIVGERKIISANGTVEFDRITNFDNVNAEFYGLGIPVSQNGLRRETLMFYPKNMCYVSVRLIITDFQILINGGPNAPNPTFTDQMTLHFEYYPSYKAPNCIHDAYVSQHSDYPINFPKDIVLTKQ